MGPPQLLTTKALFDDIARQALFAYDLQGCSLNFIRHSDNATFRIEKPGAGAFLLRIHIPIVTTMGTHGADPDAINSELLWLEALSQDTDLVLQKPVRNQAGELITRISVKDVDVPVNCTLLNWLDGEAYHRDLESEHTASQIGTILAKLHLHASQWRLPEGFKRPRRDLAYFESMLRDLKPALHPICMNSYQGFRSLPDGYQRLTEGLFIGGMVGTFSYWTSNPRAQELLATKVPHIARDYAAKFKRGEHFWFS